MDKNPRLRPIGTAEVLRCVASKVVVSHIREDATSAVGSLRKDQSSEVVLLVDASNTFNSINRNAFLHKISITCAPPARSAQSCYCANTQLSIIGGSGNPSMDGTTQSDPTAMAIYAIAIILMLVE